MLYLRPEVGISFVRATLTKYTLFYEALVNVLLKSVVISGQMAVLSKTIAMSRILVVL